MTQRVMGIKNTALIVTQDKNFHKKFSTLLEENQFSVVRSKPFSNWKEVYATKKVDCYVLDNQQNDFPHQDFLEYLIRNRFQCFILNIGESFPKALKSPYLIFNIQMDSTGVPLDTLLKNADKLLKNNKAQMELAGMLLHDTRSPLNSLIGYIELLLNETFGPLNEGQKNILEKAMDLGDTTLDMLEEINEIYQGDQSTVLTQKEPFDFASTLETVLVNNWVKADKKNIKIRKEIDPKMPALLGDNYQIQRVLTNLLTNSIKYCPENSQIIIKAFSGENNSANISIIDNGPGVPEEHLPHLFDKNFRIRTRGQGIKGYGLGLYICKVIIKSHRGKIWAENNDNGGLTVNFTLPFVSD
ncbi:MAG: hypothetical protein Kow0042_22700 [Calditrichia bacterium]